MHPLMTFPWLLNFGFFAPTLLRLSAAAFIFYIGWQRYKKPFSWTTVFYMLAAASLLLGLYSQIGAILGILVVKFDFWMNRKISKQTPEQILLYALAEIILISLLLTGPGFWAFDLPL